MARKSCTCSPGFFTSLLAASPKSEVKRKQGSGIRERQKRKASLTKDACRHNGIQYQVGCFGGLHTGCTPVAHRLEFDEKMGRGADLKRKRNG
ncbi:hypothetical protein CVU37_14225 [candidate division BRC1 bacterium HGW-BRC1-1]|nr:MAG: hypothetical protein CVU37_14225 [candidate division BRC1 bacterium HGW-BRC1-1]